MANFASQRLPAIASSFDRERTAFTAARVGLLIDVGFRVGVIAVAGGAGSGLVTVLAAIAIWGVLRGPLFGSFVVLAGMASIGAALGPVAGLLTAAVFWLSLFGALHAAD